jgi:hypothetical protein
MHYPEMWGFLQYSSQQPESGKAEFVMPEDEKMKWELRKIYYYQKLYFNNFGKYTSQLINLENIGLKLNRSYEYTIGITSSMFEAQATKGDLAWFINTEGRTWKK